MAVDVRIGVVQSAKEIDVDLADDTDYTKLVTEVEKVLQDENSVLWLTDRKGKKVCVPSKRIAYIEIGSADQERRVGFSSAKS